MASSKQQRHGKSGSFWRYKHITLYIYIYLCIYIYTHIYIYTYTANYSMLRIDSRKHNVCLTRLQYPRLLWSFRLVYMINDTYVISLYTYMYTYIYIYIYIYTYSKIKYAHMIKTSIYAEKREKAGWAKWGMATVTLRSTDVWTVHSSLWKTQLFLNFELFDSFEGTCTSPYTKWAVPHFPSPCFRSPIYYAGVSICLRSTYCIQPLD